MKVLVCGGRDYGVLKQRPGESEDAAVDRALAERSLVFAYMESLVAEFGFFSVVEGCAPGADSLAEEWTRAWDPSPRTLIHFPADWEKHGRAAGPIRNRQMLVEGKPDLVVAFPGGRGTANMVAQAEKAGVPVRIVS